MKDFQSIFKQFSTWQKMFQTLVPITNRLDHFDLKHTYHF